MQLPVLIASCPHTFLLEQSRAMASAAGTPLYQAPEMGEEEEAKTPKVRVVQTNPATWHSADCPCFIPHPPSSSLLHSRHNQVDVFSAGVVIVELNTGKCPQPGPNKIREGRRRVCVPEEERRADDMAAVRHPEIRQLADRCIVDDEADRASAAEMVVLCRALLEMVRAPAEFTIVVNNVEADQRVEMAVTVAMTLAEVRTPSPPAVAENPSPLLGASARAAACR